MVTLAAETSCFYGAAFCAFMCYASLPRSRFLDVTQRSPLRDIQKTTARETSATREGYLYPKFFSRVSTTRHLLKPRYKMCVHCK